MYPTISLVGATIPTFGLLLALGFAVVHALLYYQSKRFSYPFVRLHALTLIAVLGGSVGSRLFAMIFSGEHFSVAEFLEFSHGTLFFGFLFGLVITCGAYALAAKNSRDVLHEIDIAVPAWLAMQFFGRLGCFCSGCCYGTETSLPWGVTYHAPISSAPIGVPLHPTQLYEAILILAIMVWAFRPHQRAHVSGTLMLSVVIFYSLGRFFLEFLRADPRGTLLSGTISTSQGISMIVLPIAIALWVWRSIPRHHHNTFLRTS